MIERQIRLIIHDVRSAHNVGALLRTADGLGVEHVYLTGLTPYPTKSRGERRLPHLAARQTRQIRKTALGAEDTVPWSQTRAPSAMLNRLAADDWQLVALEQAPQSVELSQLRPTAKIVLVVGAEIGGLPIAVLRRCDQIVEIPMLGNKESFNVATATAIVLYHLRHVAT